MDSARLIQQAKAEESKQQKADLAACYARVFLGTDDGARVLADLRSKFGLDRLVFLAASTETYDTLRAALRDGERRVMKEIEDALQQGAPGLKPKQ